MSGARALLVEPAGPVHRLPAAAKVAGAFVWVFAVSITPREAMWAFAAHAGVVAAVIAVARLPARHVLRRLAIEIPFVMFALLLPLIGRGPRTEVLGVPLSTAGLWGMWAILAKATLGLGVSIVLASTTPVADLLRGLGVLRVPPLLVAICGFMVRYLDVLRDDLHRMRIARLARGADPRWLWQSRSIAATAGTLFVRSYERGERVHLAMMSRGFTGTMPPQDASDSDRGALVAVPVAMAATIAVSAWMTR